MTETTPISDTTNINDPHVDVTTLTRSDRKKQQQDQDDDKSEKEEQAEEPVVVMHHHHEDVTSLTDSDESETTTTDHQEHAATVLQEITIDDALNKHAQFGRFQYLLLQICGSGWAYDGVEMAVVPFILPHVTLEWKLDAYYRGLLSCVVFLGMFFGASMNGMVSDKWGRKIVMLYAMLITSVFGMLSSMVRGYWMFLLLRMCVGFGLGGIVPTDYSMLMEFVTMERRGPFVGLINVYYILGAMIECVFAWIVLTFASWRWLVFVSAATGLVAFCTRLFVPESPRYLLVNKMEDEALKSVQTVALWNGVDVKSNPLFRPNVKLTQSSHKQSGYSLQVSIFKQLRMVFSTQYKFTSVLLLFIWFFLSYGSWGFMILIPQRFNSASPFITYVYPLITYSVAVVGYLLSSFFMDRVPRKTMGIVAFVLSAISVMLMGVMDKHPLLLLVQSMIVNFVMTFAWSVMNIYTPELYPTRCRATGLGICNSATRIGGVVTLLFSQIMIAEFGAFLPYLTFGAAMLLGSVFIAYLPLDTLGIDLQDDIYAFDLGARGIQNMVYQPIASDEDHVRNERINDFLL